jgi:hypothetical protein
MVRKMVMELINGQMGHNIKGSFKMILSNYNINLGMDKG